MDQLLQSICVVEGVDENTPCVVRRALAFAGRLAADAGVRVYSPATVFKSENEYLRAFLLDGKHDMAAEAPPEDVFYLAPSGFTTANLEWSGVELSAVPVTADAEGKTFSDLTLQALSGLCDLIGDPDRAPLKIGGYQAAFTAGYSVFAALCAVILKKERFRQSDRAHVDALSSLCYVNWKALAMGAVGKDIRREGALAEWPVLPCKDGYVALVFVESDWPKIVEMVGDEKLKNDRFKSFSVRSEYRVEYQALLAFWLADRTKAELSEFFCRYALPCCIIATPRDLLTDPLNKHRKSMVEISLSDATKGLRPVLPYRVKILPAAPAAASPKQMTENARQRLPLEGIRILDLGIITAGAGTSAILADLGAEVLKIESETYPDPFRMWAGAQREDSPWFKFNNRNKKGIALDLKTREGHSRFMELVAKSDMVLENFRRGVIERLGIGFDDLRQVNPRILLVSITGQGLDGPGAEVPAYGSTQEGASGLAALTGYAGEKPVISGRNLNYPDQIVCLFGAAAIMAALFSQSRRPAAIHLDVSQRDTAMFTLGDEIIAASIQGERYRKGPRGNTENSFALQDIYLTADNSWLALSVGDDAVPRLLDALKLGSLSDMVAWVNRQPLTAALSALLAHGIPAAPALRGSEVFVHPWVRGGTALAYSPKGLLVKGLLFQFKKVALQIFSEAPRVGEHTREFFSDKPH
jgi:crotonobetainyl-CoA:carnitine CoA-transferase CaiB-like acyl-CoA transferase